MSIITYNQLLNTATRSREYSDDIGAALYSFADDAYAQANAANTTATSAYARANSATTSASNAYAEANSAYSTANSAYTQANSAYSMANAAYELASTASNVALYGSYDSTDESITLSIG